MYVLNLIKVRSTMVNAKKIVCTKFFDGEPQLSDFRIEFEKLPELRDGGNFLSNFLHFQNEQKETILL